MKDANSILDGDSVDVITDENFLRIPCSPVSSIEEGEKIAMKLFRVLTERNDGIGLSANQIGIQKRVAVINVKTPIYLINPIIKDFEGELIYFESCLSFPGKQVRTKRYSTLFVTCDNIPGGLYCDVPPNLNIKSSKMINDVLDMDILECVAIQHEISHLDGKTMFDFEYKQTPIRKLNKTYGRNDKISIFRDGSDEIKTIKYKEFDKYKNSGYHIIDENMFDDLKNSDFFKPLFPKNSKI